MHYYFIKASTDLGPLNFPLRVQFSQSINGRIAAEAKTRGLFIYGDWDIETIGRETFLELSGK